MAQDKIKKTSIIDWWIALPSLLLAAFGIVNVFSASSNMASGSPVTYLIKQLIFVGIAAVAGFTVFRLKLTYFQRPKLLYILSVGVIFLLLVARFLTPEINGAHGWIMLAGIGIQPAEFAKVVLILYCANFFSKQPYQPGRLSKTTLDLSQWVVPVIIVGIIFIMPDTGNAAICGFIIIVMLLSAGFHYIWAFALYSLGFLAWIVTPIVIKVMNITPEHYKTARLVAFADPWEYIQTSGAQLINSYYAISNGGLIGVGPGNSIQKTGYLPEPNTDFIMAVMAEEWGSIVVVAVLILLGTIIGRLIFLGAQTESIFLRTILYGISAYLTVQALFNLGAVSGLLPITGVTFPFISYGGSSALVIGLMIGTALNASASIYHERAQQKMLVASR